LHCKTYVQQQAGYLGHLVLGGQLAKGRLVSRLRHRCGTHKRSLELLLLSSCSHLHTGLLLLFLLGVLSLLHHPKSSGESDSVSFRL
jgi:hypothetical protein